MLTCGLHVGHVAVVAIDDVAHDDDKTILVGNGHTSAIRCGNEPGSR
jgi:hypothetical protein